MNLKISKRVTKVMVKEMGIQVLILFHLSLWVQLNWPTLDCGNFPRIPLRFL
jgi:hypothetical protein